LRKSGVFGLSLAEMELTVAHSAMAAASRESSDFNFEGFESVCQVAKGTIEEFALALYVPNSQ
jgi:hypothetical protein